MNEWLRWASEANLLDPLGAEARVRFLARGILSLRESTEGPAAYEAGKLLIPLAWRVSPRWAVALQQVFADGGVISWTDGLAIVINLAIDDPEANVHLAGAIVASILMPLSDSDHGELCRRLIQVAPGPESATKLCTQLGTAANTFASTASREGWLRPLSECCGEHRVHLGEALTPADEVNDDLSRTQEHTLTLELVSGEKLTEDVVFQRMVDATSFIGLLEQAADRRYFPWKERFTSWVFEQPRAAIWQLLDGLRRLAADTRLQGTCLERLSVIDHTSAVFDAAATLLKSLEASDWDRWWSGGTKTTAAKVMAEIDRGRAFPLLFDELVDDLLSDVGHWSTIANQLGDILPCLETRPPADQVWKHIEEYLTACFSHVEPECVFDVPIVPGTANDAMLDVLDFAIDHPVQILSDGARHILFESLASSVPEIELHLRRWLATPDDKCRTCLSVLVALSKQAPAVVGSVAEVIASVGATRDMDIRLLCQELGERTGLFVPSSPVVDESLVAEFRTRPLIDARPRLDGKPRITSTKPLEDTFDARELVRPFQSDVELVAQAASLDIDVVLHRVHDVMKQLVSEVHWNEDGERQLRARCERMGLNYTFTRPRSRVVRRAILQVAGELTDAGRIPAEHSIMYSMLRTSDPEMEHVVPTPRPPFVVGFSRPQSRDDRAIWQQIDLATAQAQFSRADNGWVVVAEAYDWFLGALHEERRSVVHLANADRSRDEVPDRLFACRIKERVSSYHDVKNVASDEPAFENELVVENLTFDFDSPGGSWLAVNPVLARKLGWEPNRDGLFEWTANGEIVAKSVWWMDGHPQFTTRFSDDCSVGSGWVVLMAADAFRRLQDILGVFRHSFVLKRTARHTEHDVEPTELYWSDEVGVA